MGSLTSDQITGEVLDHLGLVSSMIKKLSLVELLDEKLPVSASKGAKVSMGKRVAAMILNGLGFMDDRLYMFPDFLANKPVERLLGEGLNAADFNDDALGRCLDSIHGYGTSKLFSELAFNIGRRFGLLGPCSHVDTTTLTLYGDYEGVGEEGATPAYGYSKQKRMDLKQVVLLLATTGKGNLPIWMASHNGNASDQKTLHEAAERIEAFNQQLKDAPSFIHIADSAMYQSCVKEATQLRWLSRVPERIKEAKQWVQHVDADLTWTDIGNGYRISPQTSRYGDVKQRWLLVSSKQAYERECKTLSRRIDKELELQTKALWHLSNKVFGCEKDAQHALAQFSKGLHYHKAETSLIKVEGYPEKGRPKKGATKEVIGYKIKGSLVPDEEAIAVKRSSKGRFILATNELDEQVLSDEQMLSEYKAQAAVETGFKFIKDDSFELSSVFLKKPERIDALMMVMTLCLMVYNLSQHHLHTALDEHKDTVLNQLKKATNRPSMKWIFRQFHGIQVLRIDTGQEPMQMVINVKPHLAKIVAYFGPEAMNIYSVKAAA